MSWCSESHALAVMYSKENTWIYSNIEHMSYLMKWQFTGEESRYIFFPNSMSSMRARLHTMDISLPFGGCLES